MNTPTVINSSAHRSISNGSAVPDVHHDVPNTHSIVSAVRKEAANTLTIASDVHRNTVKSREDTDGQNPAVSTTLTLTITD